MRAPARSDRSNLAEWSRTVDRPILILAIVLIITGLVMSLAAGPIAADRMRYDDRLFFVLRHAGFAAAGVLILLTVSTFDTIRARRVSALVFGVTFVLLVVIAFVGHEAKGGQRWIRFGGFSFQPSELIKPAVIVLCAWLLAQRRHYPGGPWAWLALAIFIATLGLLLNQPDVGQSALLGLAFAATFFVAGLPLRWVLAFGGGGAALGTLLYFTIPHVKYRIDTFFDSDTEVYQIERALTAQSNGGLMGVGPGEGVIKRSIPDGHTDFIFSIMAEEYGLFASLLMVAVFVAITLRGLILASKVSDPYPRAAASGLFALFGLQAAINLMVNVNLMPPKGMTLPFVSYGGSSMIGCALTLGLALALVRRIPVRSGRRIYV